MQTPPHLEGAARPLQLPLRILWQEVRVRNDQDRSTSQVPADKCRHRPPRVLQPSDSPRPALTWGGGEALALLHTLPPPGLALLCSGSLQPAHPETSPDLGWGWGVPGPGLALLPACPQQPAHLRACCTPAGP